jgi:hypothetical protein
MNEIKFAEPWDLMELAAPVLAETIRRQGNGWWVLVDGSWVSDRGHRRRDDLLKEFVRQLPDSVYWSKIKYKATRNHGIAQLWAFLGPEIMLITLSSGWQPPTPSR